MPMQPARLCTQPGCFALVYEGSRCPEHRTRRPSAAAQGYGHAWRKLRKDFLAAYPDCVVCGQPATDVHHIIPLAQGGASDWGNLESRCHAHHSEVTARQSSHWGAGS